MNKKRKIILARFTLFTIIGLIFMADYISSDREFLVIDTESSIAVVDASTESLNANVDTIKLGLIGDSWVAGEKLDPVIETYLRSMNIDADIISYGHPGAKSQHILSNLLSDESNPYSSNALLQDDAVKHIIIIAGVNDTAGHIGSDFYVHHMTELIEVINSYGKTAIILEVPEYGIEEPEKFKSALKHNLYKILFDDNETDVIEQYRQELASSLSETDLDFDIVPFNPIASDYHEDISLYKDQFHLNSEGNTKLGKYLGSYIHNNIIK